jgi:hypothetical protein
MEAEAAVGKAIRRPVAIGLGRVGGRARQAAQCKCSSLPASTGYPTIAAARPFTAASTSSKVFPVAITSPVTGLLILDKHGNDPYLNARAFDGIGWGHEEEARSCAT